MKKLIVLTLILLCIIISSACAQATPQPITATSQPINEMINPGDKIGDFLVTTGDDDKVLYTTKIHCPFNQNTMTETCEIPIGTKVNVGLGVYGDKLEELDAYWSDQSYEMTIDGRAVNLQAFGSIDIPDPIVHTMRLWNVVIVSDKPGKITIQHSGEMAGDSAQGTNILVYTMP